ncbi:hypothetical protein [Sphingomonas aerolata]|uniref:hypothetical protein n=1 Tax=Sphingomonas aerolata TaxID=185951 RepID=UPI002FE06B19
MRVMMGVIAAGLIVAGCGDKDAQRAEADAGAVGFVPLGHLAARFRRQHGTALPHARPQRR